MMLWTGDRVLMALHVPPAPSVDGSPPKIQVPLLEVNVTTGAIRTLPFVVPHPVIALYAPTEDVLVIAGDKGQLVALRGDKPLATAQSGVTQKQGYIELVDVSSDGRLLAIGNSAGRIALFDFPRSPSTRRSSPVGVRDDDDRSRRRDDRDDEQGRPRRGVGRRERRAAHRAGVR